MKISFSILLLIASSSLSFAQSDFRDGFIVTLKNDTLRAEVDFRTPSMNYSSYIFRALGTTTEYLPDQIKGYGYDNGKYYTSEKMESEFVEVLVSGVLSLYKLENHYLLEKDDELHRLESKKIRTESEGRTITKETGNWKGLTSYAINDCIPDATLLLKACVLRIKVSQGS